MSPEITSEPTKPRLPRPRIDQEDSASPPTGPERNVRVSQTDLAHPTISLSSFAILGLLNYLHIPVSNLTNEDQQNSNGCSNYFNHRM